MISFFTVCRQIVQFERGSIPAFVLIKVVTMVQKVHTFKFDSLSEVCMVLYAYRPQTRSEAMLEISTLMTVPLWRIESESTDFLLSFVEMIHMPKTPSDAVRLMQIRLPAQYGVKYAATVFNPPARPSVARAAPVHHPSRHAGRQRQTSRAPTKESCRPPPGFEDFHSQPRPGSRAQRAPATMDCSPPQPTTPSASEAQTAQPGHHSQEFLLPGVPQQPVTKDPMASLEPPGSPLLSTSVTKNPDVDPLLPMSRSQPTASDKGSTSSSVSVSQAPPSETSGYCEYSASEVRSILKCSIQCECARCSQDMLGYVNSKVKVGISQARQFLSFGVRNLSPEEVERYLQKVEHEQREKAKKDYFTRFKREKIKEKCSVSFIETFSC